MTDVAIASSSSVRYRRMLLYGLLFVTILPAAAIFINYQVDGSIYTLTWLITTAFMINSAHTWMTLAYYTDRKWLRHFGKRPGAFFLAPVLILASTMLVMVFAVEHATVLIFIWGIFNLWHAAKQNWGIISVVGRIRRQNVSALRIPLCWAWPFFVIPMAMQFPQITDHIGQPAMYSASVVSAMLYVVFFGVLVSRSGFLKSEPLALTFGLALGTYFLPLVFLFGKPYGFAFWAVAHGLQYLLMVLMSLSFRERRSVTTGKLAANLGTVGSILGLTVLVWYFVSQSTGGSMGGRVALGFFWGVPFVHFWVDAFIWKFSRKEIRELHGDAFAL